MNRGSAPDEIGVGAGVAHRIVVGLDGSRSADQTVAWASREAVARSVSLRLVGCFGLASTVHGDPRDTLLDAALGADLLVIDGSNSGTVRHLLLGTVPRTAARRSACPVVVVRGRPRQYLRRIAVGIDASNAASSALGWAIAEAECHGSELLLVHAWHPTPLAGRSMRATDLDRADAQCVLDLAIRHCEQRTNLPVSGELIEGEAAAVLTAASEHADLLAIGSRGRSGYKTMLFGSVALTVAGQAACPVAVIHPHVSSRIDTQIG